MRGLIWTVAVLLMALVASGCTGGPEKRTLASSEPALVPPGDSGVAIVERPKPVLSFEIGEKVKIVGGHFASFDGVVESVDQEHARLRVSVSIFGRATPVDLEYSQVEKTA